MTGTSARYVRNPLTVRDRRLSTHPSPWVRSFACDDVRVLIVCRGPIRKEAMDVFDQMGLGGYGILLSERDSIVYTQALAPELRAIHPSRVHRVRDYTGATRDERIERIGQILGIARDHGYGYIFAGYGFMAEDDEFVRAIEESGLRFIGPCAHTQRSAGRKDEAKRTAVAQDVSVTPGVNDVTTRALLKKAPDVAALRALSEMYSLDVSAGSLDGPSATLVSAAEALLAASYTRGVDLLTVDEIGTQVAVEVAAMFVQYPGARVRLKAIGGGGGKGQRILTGIALGDPHTARDRAMTAASVATEKLIEVLAEVKAAGVGDNKNVLVELNVEETRHNEIQLVGNGDWCISLGGRDCSLQMHEQKLLEVSITVEGLAAAAAEAERSGQHEAAEALRKDVTTLQRMESEAERFGHAVGLDSASTFECIVDGDRHFFMEVNTRIQVEHRVSELCYALRFAKPGEPGDGFEVTSLVEAMVLLARHGARLPRPERVLREGAAVEARLNATNGALAPHAGGTIVSWTDPIDGEIRDDQGICLKNPDTGIFMRYRLAGAYDGNIALLVTVGDDRRGAYLRLAEVLRRTHIRGLDLATNLAFHQGIVQWFIARGVHAKPTTRFVVPYLTLVGTLKEESDGIDLACAWSELCAHHDRRVKSHGETPEVNSVLKATREALGLKETLLVRVLTELFAEPHHLSAWLSANRGGYEIEGGRVRWRRNPVAVLSDTYHLLDMDPRPGVPAAHVIWDHDQAMLERALGFYKRVESRMEGGTAWPAVAARLEDDTPLDGMDAATWAAVQSAHLGFQLGMELLGLPALVGARMGFEDLRVEADLRVAIPERLLDTGLQAQMARVLAPPPRTRDDEIVAVSGGMFYAQEAPDKPPLIRVGEHFAAGQPLYILEVMKMFNRVLAPFAGRIEAVLVTRGEGTVVHKGQSLFKVVPDERHVEEDPAARHNARRSRTRSYLRALMGD